MMILAQPQHCYHTYLIVATFLVLSFHKTTTCLYQSQNLLIMSIVHCQQPIYPHIFSLHIGATTTAASASLEESIQFKTTLGHWKSSAYLLYIRLNSLLANFSTTMAQCPTYHGLQGHLFICTNYHCVTLIPTVLQPYCNSLLVQA